MIKLFILTEGAKDLSSYINTLKKLDKKQVIEIYYNLNSWKWDERLGEKPMNWDSIPNFLSNDHYKLPTKHKVISPIMKHIRSVIGEKRLLMWHHLNNCGMSRLEHEIWWVKRFFSKLLGAGFYSNRNKKIITDILGNLAEQNKNDWIGRNLGGKF